MILDIFNKPYEIKVNDRVYTLEYDNAAFIELEHRTGKGTFELCSKVLDAAFGLEECLQMVLCGLLKHHVKDETDELREIFMQNPYLLVKNAPMISAAFITPLMPPEIMDKAAKKEAQDSGKKQKVRL